MLNVKEAWTIDARNFSDLEFSFYVAIRTHDEKTFQSAGFKTLERSDTLLFKVMDTGKASEYAFEESCQSGINKLNQQQKVT